MLIEQQGIQEPSGADLGSIDVDSLMNEIENAPSEDRAMGAAPEPQSQPAQDGSQSPTQTQSEIEFTWNGKQIKAPLDKAKQWAQQGYDYAQKMAEYNRRQQEFSQKETWAKEAEGRYKAIDEYVQQNPQFWDHVTQSWQQQQISGQQGQGIDPANPFVQKLLTEINDVKQFKQTLEQEKAAQARVQEDQQLDTEIKSIREQYGDLDFDTVGAEGTSLEQRVIQHAIQHNIASFKTAFRDLLHDDLLRKAEERGKEQITKDIQKRNKTGLLGTSPTPTKGVNHAADIKTKSYDRLLDEALSELRA
jgi:hypothetical protein